jgi:hypothetical protein
MDFKAAADDFFVNLDLQTTLALPNSRETVLQFFEAAQRQFDDMTSFYQREGGQYVLEGDHDAGSYRWMELQANQVSAGYFNPPDAAAAYALHSWVLDRVVYFLGISGLDVEALDVLLGFNLDYCGNRDAVVAEALMTGSSLGAFGDEPPGTMLECQPNVVISLSEDCSTQARLLVETYGSSYQVRTGNYTDDPISVYFTVRQYPVAGKVLSLAESFARQCRIAEDLAARIVVPQVIEPISAAITAAG